jgi:hypothetical protein
MQPVQRQGTGVFCIDYTHGSKWAGRKPDDIGSGENGPSEKSWSRGAYGLGVILCADVERLSFVTFIPFSGILDYVIPNAHEI